MQNTPKAGGMVESWRYENDGKPLPSRDFTARLVLPAGSKGPAFLVYSNFDLFLLGIVPIIMRWRLGICLTGCDKIQESDTG